MTARVASLPLLCLALAAGSARAQETTVIQSENVRFGYAQVLRVTPVYQVLNATRVEQRCAQVTPRPDATRLSRAIGSVRERWSDRQASEVEGGCRSVAVAREFRRPIAYDVDYVYKGAKYRSRLPEDPGNRLRIRIGVTPVVAGVRDP